MNKIDSALFEGVGYRHFVNFVIKDIIPDDIAERIYKGPKHVGHWSQETKETLLDLLKQGVPSYPLGRITGVSEPAVARIERENNRILYENSDRIEVQKSLIQKWYPTFVTHEKKIDGYSVGLVDFLNSYEGTLPNEIANVTDSIFLLSMAGIKFPYEPTKDDAYIIGANQGCGSLRNNCSLFFNSKEQDLAEIDKLAMFNPVHKEKGQRDFPMAWSRVLMKCGLEKGNRTHQIRKVPEWITGEDYIANYLGGLFDFGFKKKIQEIYMKKTTNPKLEQGFLVYLNTIAQKFQELDIQVTKKEKIWPVEEKREEDKLITGGLALAVSKKNIAMIKERLITRTTSSKEFLDQRLESYR
ncbi:MAG: hypothetical protein ABIC04_08560 [Nanoarchaeota archaeon]